MKYVVVVKKKDTLCGSYNVKKTCVFLIINYNVIRWVDNRNKK